MRVGWKGDCSTDRRTCSRSRAKHRHLVMISLSVTGGRQKSKSSASICVCKRSVALLCKRSLFACVRACQHKPPLDLVLLVLLSIFHLISASQRQWYAIIEPTTFDNKYLFFYSLPTAGGGLSAISNVSLVTHQVGFLEAHVRITS